MSEALVKHTTTQVFSARPREFLANLDRAVGRDVRDVLLDSTVHPDLRVARALQMLIAHVSATEVLADAAEHDNAPDWVRRDV